MAKPTNAPLIFVRNSGCCTSASFVTKKSARATTLSLLSASFGFSDARNSIFCQCQPRFPTRVGSVSIVHLDYAPPAPEFDLRREIIRLKSLRSRLASASDKNSVLDLDANVRRIFQIGKDGGIGHVLPPGIDCRGMYYLKCLVAAGQAHVIGLQDEDSTSFSTRPETSRNAVKQALFKLVEMIERMDIGNDVSSANGSFLSFKDRERMKNLLSILEEVERFYDCIGGIIGYQIMVLELLSQSIRDHKSSRWAHPGEESSIEFEIHVPKGIDLAKDTEYASQAAIWGIEGLPDVGEIYPLGGSGDRLGLVEAETGECLPAAMLPYCGRSLLEGLIRDVEAREYLYTKLFKKQCITPIAIMTSAAKRNHERITSLFEKHRWFNRGRASFRLFEQPLVPAISSEDGHWLITRTYEPLCKPGGHGVIWKLAYDKGIFDWFYSHGRKGANVRQVSNVVAATDVTMLALAGIGLRHDKKLGFASCERIAGATEGINVLMERKTEDGNWSYGISSVEYTHFDLYGIASAPSSTGCQSEFPANTNIMYVDLKSIEGVMAKNDETSLPGILLNTKKPISFVDCYGQRHSVCGGRLECTMQNIADNFANIYPSTSWSGTEGGHILSCSDSFTVWKFSENLDTFIVYNQRRKVTSSAKKKGNHAKGVLRQTPEGSFLDIMRNAYDLLSGCNIELPQVEGNDKYVDSGLPFLVLLHPALGPLWQVSRQKFSGGLISQGSELQLEVSEFLWRDVRVEGSLAVIAENITGSAEVGPDGDPIMRYGHRCGRCRLENVHVLNKGINWGSATNVYWKNEVQRLEMCKIVLNGNAEFFASNVTLPGDLLFQVPSGCKMIVTSAEMGFEVNVYDLEEHEMENGSWTWSYKINGSHIELELV